MRRRLPLLLEVDCVPATGPIATPGSLFGRGHAFEKSTE